MKSNLVYLALGAALCLCQACGIPRTPSTGSLMPPVSKEDQATAETKAAQQIVRIEAMPDAASRRAYLGKHLDVAKAFGMAKDEALNARLRRALGYK